jgi:hypothetical protein
LPRLPIKLPLLLVLLRHPLCLVQTAFGHPHGLAPRQWRQVLREREVPLKIR